MRKKKDGADKCKIDKKNIIYEGVSIIALGATTFKNVDNR
jgi:hypothetical protein